MASGIAQGDRLELPVHSAHNDIAQLVSDVASRYEISALEPLLRVCKSAAARQDLSIGVLGRFKAGKSSFLNHFHDREVLPVGVIPVTSVITEVVWGAAEQAKITYLDGHTEAVELSGIGEFVTESKNPENRKQVETVRLHLRDLYAYKGLRFVDTPGLDSVFSHNTESSVGWSPNVDIALVAIGVDPPLTQQDVDLIRKLFEYTPKVCVLLTKVDVLTEAEQIEVLQFLKEQLNRAFERQIQVFPYSTKAGFESLRSKLRHELIEPTLAELGDQKRVILTRKLLTLVRECIDYLQLALRSAEMVALQRGELRARVIGSTHALADTKLELQLIARHQVGGTRNQIEKVLAPQEHRVTTGVASALENEYVNWRMPFGRLLETFESWISKALIAQLTAISSTHQIHFLVPARETQRQFTQVLQAFRDRLSERTLELFGVPLRTTEPDIEMQPPKAPDVKIGRVFDHNWELLSPLIPMMLVRGAVKRRILRRVSEETFKNLSRLTSQWADVISATILQMRREAEHRLEQFVSTVARLTTPSEDRIANIETDLQHLRNAQASLEKNMSNTDMKGHDDRNC